MQQGKPRFSLGWGGSLWAEVFFGSLWSTLQKIIIDPAR